jgi:YD repeat-containing protein
MDNGYSRFLGATPSPGDWTVADCDWTRFQYLCPAETGAGLGCGTILPFNVGFECALGYTPTSDGHCRLDPPVEKKPCNCDTNGQLQPTVGHPIVLGSGAKILAEEDFASADGQLRIGRHYRSFQVGRPLDGKVLPRSQPKGLTGGWNFDFAYEVQLGLFSGSPAVPNAKVAVLDPDGTGVAFVLQPSGQWIPDPAFGAANTPKDIKLEYVGTLPANLADVVATSSTWKVTDGDDNVWTFQTRIGPNGGQYYTGTPNQKAVRGGYTWNFAYNADSSLNTITDSFGRTATFTWNKFYISSLASPPAGALPYPLAVASVALPDSTSLRYTYDPAPATVAPSKSMIRRLVKVEHLSAASAVLDATSYLYEDARFPTHITGIIDNRGIRTRTYAYDSQGRATLTQVAGGADAQQVEYGVNGTAQTRRVTNPLGKATTYSFNAYSAGPADYRLAQVSGEASANTPASTAQVSYGTDTFISSQTDAEGRTTTTTRDARGRALSVVEASGTPSQRTTTTTWHPTFNVPATIARPGLTETRNYNAAGQLTSVVLTDTTIQSVPYSTNGQVRTYTYGWDTKGRLLSINGPLAVNAQGKDDLTSFVYDAQGNLSTITNGLAQVTTMAAYDANGRPGTMTDANGIVTAYTYDGLGRIQTITRRHPTTTALNAVTTLTYDAVGQLTGVTLPSTDSLLMDYDAAGRLATIRAASGERRDYTYDAAGNVTAETVKRIDGSPARQFARAFDELSRMVRESSGQGHTAQQGYDKLGNVVSMTSPNGNVTTSAFDPLNRVINTVAPDTGVTQLAFDARDNLLSHTDPVAVITTFVYNGFGEAIQEVSPDRGTSTYLYDVAGRMTQATDGRGQAVVYSYDVLGRVTSKVPQGRPASETVTFTWDTGGIAGSYQVGRLGKIVDGSGTTLFKYDHRGNVLARQQTVGTSTAAQLAYLYDLADRITQITYPSGRLVVYGYDSKGRVNLVQTKATSAVTTWTTLASGNAYEPFGPVKGMTLGNGLALVNDWGNDGRLASRRLYRVAGGTNLSYLEYRYDADDNIAAIGNVLTPAASVLYGYDKMGRMSQVFADSGAAAGTTTLAYAAGKNRLASVTSAAGARSIAYDARGNTLSETRPGAVSAALTYDGHGRLTGYSRSDVGARTFAYNGLDDRVSMVTPITTRRFVYAADGRVMGEYGLSAADVKAEFIWAVPDA